MKLKLAIALLATAIAAPALADPITYTFTGSFTGTLNGGDFTVPATFTGIGDTDDIMTNGFSNYLQLQSLTALSGGTTYTITDPTFFYVNIFGYAGLEFGAFDDTSYFSGNNDALIGYDGVSNVATTPIDYFGAVASFNTDMGFVTLTDATDGTFGAAVTAAVPEPATWGLMILGFGAVGATLRRRSTKVAFAA